MSSRIFATPENLDWKKAYLAAVLETDRLQVPALVETAREKLTQRLREIWAIGALPCDEVEAIHDALYLLEALLSSLSYRHDNAQRGKWDQDS